MWVVRLPMVMLAVLVVAEQQARAEIIFDNGSIAGMQSMFRNSGPYSIYEDFTLTDSTTITGFRWSQHDESDIHYLGTELSIYEGLPSPDKTPLLSGEFLATRTPAAQPLPPDVWIFTTNHDRYAYEISGLSLQLSPGLYYFGIHNRVTDGYTSWDVASATPQARIVWASSQSQPAEIGFIGYDSVFQVMGTNVAPVPEPSSLAMFGCGTVALVVGAARRVRSRCQGR